YDKKSHSAPLVRRAILRYALTCPAKPAAEFVAGRRKAEPEVVKEGEEGLQFEKTPAKVSTRSRRAREPRTARPPILTPAPLTPSALPTPGRERIDGLPARSPGPLPPPLARRRCRRADRPCLGGRAVRPRPRGPRRPPRRPPRPAARRRRPDRPPGGVGAAV